MRKFSRAGFLTLVAVWATVLLVPSLRTAFRAQLQGSPLLWFSALPTSQGLNGYWESYALQNPGDRDILLQAALEYPRSSEKARIIDHGAQPPEEVHELLPSPVFPGAPALHSHRETVRRLDALAEKFPGDALIVATYLRTAYPRFVKRVPGERNDAHFKARQERDIPPGSYWPSPADYSTADLQRAIALTARGQQLEPENCFFDWMKSAYLTLAWRDGEALQSLESASRKPQFNDYFLGQLQSKEAALEKILRRPLVTEEKQHLWGYAEIPQVTSYRQIASLITPQITRARQQGQHHKALRLAAALGRTGAHMRPGLGYYFAGTVGGAVERGAYLATIPDEVQALRKLKSKNFRDVENILFQGYASRYGRPELGREYRQSWESFEKERKQWEASRVGLIYAVPVHEGFITLLLWRLGVIVLLLLPLALLVPVVVWGLAQEPRYRELLKWQESTPDEIPYEGEVKKGVWACAGVRALGVYLVVGAVATFILQREEWLLGWGRRAIRCFGGEMSFYEAAFWNLSDLDGAAGRLVALMILPLLFGGLFTVWRAVAWQKLMNGDARKQPLWSRLLGFLMTGFLVQALLLFAFSETESGFFEGGYWPLLGMTLCAGVLLLEQFLQWRKRNYRLETVRYGLHLLYHSLAIWLVVGSVLYLCTLVVALPLRNRAEVKIDRILAVGEMRTILEQDSYQQ